VVSELLSLILVLTWYSNKLLSMYGDFIITPLVSLLDNYVLFRLYFSSKFTAYFGCVLSDCSMNKWAFYVC
jgi:hypothetical protein